MGTRPADFSAPRREALMIISSDMSPRNKDFRETPIEPEILDPSEEEIAQIGPPPEAPPPATPEDQRTTDSPAVVPVTALQQYLAEVRRHPYLSKEEELHLFHEYRAHGNRDAAVKLIMANLRVSISIAAEYLHTGADHMDLIQEGNVGLRSEEHTSELQSRLHLVCRLL